MSLMLNFLHIRLIKIIILNMLHCMKVAHQLSLSAVSGIEEDGESTVMVNGYHFVHLVVHIGYYYVSH